MRAVCIASWFFCPLSEVSSNYAAITRSNKGSKLSRSITAETIAPNMDTPNLPTPPDSAGGPQGLWPCGAGLIRTDDNGPDVGGGAGWGSCCP